MAIRYVNVGAVRVFDHVAPDKQQALEPLEEAAEVFGAWQLMEGIEDTGVREKRRLLLLDECADVIQATLNLVAALGCDDMRLAMTRCEDRNRKRGRIGKDA